MHNLHITYHYLAFSSLILSPPPLKSLSITGVLVIRAFMGLPVRLRFIRLSHTILCLLQTFHRLAVSIGLRRIRMFTTHDYIVAAIVGATAIFLLISWKRPVYNFRFRFQCVQVPGLVERLGRRLNIWSRSPRS